MSRNMLPSGAAPKPSLPGRMSLSAIPHLLHLWANETIRAEQHSQECRPRGLALHRDRRQSDADASALLMNAATSRGCDSITAWLLFSSATFAPDRRAILRCAVGGII